MAYAGIKVWVNEGVQSKLHAYPWDEIEEQHRPGGDKWNSVVTENGVQFFTSKGVLVWFPFVNLVKVEVTDVQR